MKRVGWILSLAIGSGCLLFGEATARARLGMKLGLERAGQDWEYANYDLSIDRVKRTGFSIALFGDIPVADLFAVRPELQYTQKGSGVEIDRRGYADTLLGTETFYDRVDYLSVMITGKARLPGLSFSPYLFAGPRMDIKLSARSEVGARQEIAPYELTVAGLVLGVGVEQSLGVTSVLLEFQYQHDLGDALTYVDPENTLTIKNTGFSILAGLYF